MAQRIRSMTEGSPMRLLIAFALPLMVGNVFQQLYTVVDTAVVGQFVGVSALASLGAADSPNWGVLGIIQGLTQGFSILMAQHFGAKDHRELSRSVGASVTLCLLFALLLEVGGQLWAEPLLRLLNTPPGRAARRPAVPAGLSTGAFRPLWPTTSWRPYSGPWETPKPPCTPLWWRR